MKRLIMAAALASFAFPLLALEVKSGLMKVSLYENSGRFNLYYLQDVSKETYLPLLFERDPRTTSLNLCLNDKIYRLGESGEFRVSARKTDNGAEFVFKSSSCQVTQSFTFTTSQGSSLSDGVQMRILVENVSERDMTAGIRLILDTYLGEKSGTHFLSDLKPKISTEAVLNTASKEQWIASPLPDSGMTGLKLLLNAGTRPDSVILANWSRINSSPWIFAYDQTRNFTLQPYSINDSAIALNFDPVTVARSRSRTIDILLCNQAAGAPAVDVVRKTSQSLDSIPVTSSTKVTAVQADLLAIRDVIDRINQKIASGASLSPEEKKDIQDTIDRLKARKSAY